jgi:hypothetical protein
LDNVRKKQRDGAVDTAIIKGDDGRLRAARGADEVVQHHYEVAVKWMGDEHRRWYYDAEGCIHEIVDDVDGDGEPALVGGMYMIVARRGRCYGGRMNREIVPGEDG